MGWGHASVLQGLHQTFLPWLGASFHPLVPFPKGLGTQGSLSPSAMSPFHYQEVLISMATIRSRYSSRDLSISDMTCFEFVENMSQMGPLIDLQPCALLLRGKNKSFPLR